jgi:hypothetical protein
MADGLFILAGQDEVPCDLRCPRTAAGAPCVVNAGIWLLASLTQQVGELVMQACPDRVGDLLVDRIAQQGVPESCPPVIGSQQARA